MKPSLRASARGRSKRFRLECLQLEDRITPSGGPLNYAVIDLASGQTIGQNSGPVAGNELLGNGVKAAFSGGGNGQITGVLYYDNTVSGTGTFGQLQIRPTTVQVSTTVTQAALSAARSLSNYAAGLTPTQTFSQINNSQTISGNGGINVINVGSLQNPTLTLSGSPNDVFIFNVSGNYQTNRPMILSGGVKPGNILFNFTATSGNVFQTSGGDLSYGTYLATHGGSFQFSNLNLTGQLINTAGNVQFVSGSKIPCFIPFGTTPTITTCQQPATATVGSSIADRATVTGLVNPSSGDTVTFNLYSSATVQNSSTLLFSNTQPLNLSTGMATSASYTTTATGTDYWVATFNGDATNNSVSSGPTAEPVCIRPSTPTITTCQLPATATVGSSIADKATITGLVNPSSGDTVTFKLYNSATMQNSSTLLFSITVPLNLSTGTATSASYTTTATGTDYWVATFNGDANNNCVSSGPTDEPVCIRPSTPTITTCQQPATATVGSSIADRATITGLINPNSGDTVTFKLYSSATVQNSSTLLFSITVLLNLSTDTATSPSYTTTATGTYYWVATFNGDANNNCVSSGPTDEPVCITPLYP
jgi:hypothetical protein